MHRLPDGTLTYSATDLVGFLECGHLTNLDRALIAGQVKKPDVGDDPGLELLRRRGWEHEQRYITDLEAQTPPRTVTPLDGSYERPIQVRADETIAAMRRGDDVIFQATVFDGRWVGHPDFLMRTPGESALGDWHYEVADTKLAHSAKASALIQIASYVEQIARIQGRVPEHVYVVTGGAQIVEHRFRTAEMMAYYRGAKTRFEAALATELDLANSYPEPVEHCAVCRWYRAECNPTWKRDDALPLVAGISRSQRQELTALEVTTRGTLATATVEKRFARVHDQARLQVASDGLNVPVYELLKPDLDEADAPLADRGLSALPEPSSGDMFFDIEGDPFAFWEGLEYLFGIWDNGEYRQIWALDRAQEKVAFEAVMDLFIGRLEQDDDMHIYHYGVYEPSRLRRLAGLHATRQEELDRLLRGRVFVDLYRVVRQGLIVGSERYSIKNLEPLYSFKREIDLRDANQSIVEFEKMLEEGDPGGEIKTLIAGYNKDDCVSTERLRDWLEARRPEAALQFEMELPRPPKGEQAPPNQDLSDRIREVQELTARLTADIPADSADQTEIQQATWLVAHLLDWHRREDKSTWWRYYDLMSKSDEDLIDEAEPIGGLVFESKSELARPARSDIYGYRFPAQDYKIDVDDKLNDPALYAAGEKTKTGTVYAIDEKALTIDIKRGREWAGPHPTSVVEVDVIEAKAQRKSLLRLGEWVAKNGLESESPEWRAVRDLIRRRAPRLVGGSDGGPLVPPGESGTDGARRLAVLLDGTTLAIQGPPGSGKTYTGARMVVDLVRAGRRVAITSNSHKVITNLLEAIIEAVPSGAAPLRIIQKGKEHEALAHPWVKRTDENADVADALTAGEVDIAAGTPWLWAREDMDGLVDTLFVDEAGQVSLANVASMGGATRNIVLLGDPQQLDQPTQGVHPDGAGVSALGHFLAGAEVVPPERGLFLEQTYRMHPLITAYTSEMFYEGKLRSVAGLENQRVEGTGALAGSGLRWLPVEHDGNTNASPEEAEKVVEIVRGLIGREWVNAKGNRRPIGAADFRLITPFNAQRLLIDNLLREAGIADIKVGTVDKFQGQQAPVSIYTLATSRPEDAPRGMAFLYSLNRLNVATSRAKALAIVVASPRLLSVAPRTPEQLRGANGLAAFVEAAAADLPAIAIEPDSGGQSPIQLAMHLG